MSKICVSIIIPIHNVEKYLRNCLDSCISQTLKEIEIICIDDCSDDNCKQIIEVYAMTYPQKIISVYLSENLRQGGARNIGIKMARGEYLCFVDGDDYIDSKMCEVLYNIANSHKRDLVCCDGYSVEKDVLHYYNVTNEFQIRSCAVLNHFTSQCFMIIKKNIIIDNNLYYPEKVFSEDTAVVPLWYIKATSREKVKLPLYYVVRHGDSSRHSAEFLDQLQILICVGILVKNAKRIKVYQQYKPQIDAFIYSRIGGFMSIIGSGILSEYNVELLQKELSKWKSYCFDKSLFYRFFTKKETLDIQQFIENQGIYKPDREENDLYEDVKGNIRELFYHIQNVLKRTIVVWGYGLKGKKIVNTLHFYGYQYVVGDNKKQLWGTITNFGNKICSIKEITAKVQRPFFVIASCAQYQEICNSLNVKQEEAIDIISYIENGMGVLDIFKN